MMSYLVALSAAVSLSVAIFGQVPSIPLPSVPHTLALPSPNDTYVIESRAENLPRIDTQARSWARMVPVHFILKAGDCEGILPHRICVHLVPDKMFKEIASERHWPDSWVGATQPMVGSDGSEIWVDMYGDDPDQIILHELGHAQGLDHDAVTPSAMFHLTSPLATMVTCRDIAQWFQVRKRPVPHYCAGDPRPLSGGGKR